MTHAPRLHGLVLAAALALALSPAARAEVLLTQPNVASISPIFLNPKVSRKPVPPGQFAMVIWQPNPNRADGLTVPVTSWDAGVKTGLHVPNLREGQTGYLDKPGVTVGQASGGEVGAYLNARDLSSHGVCEKMMITAQYKFPTAAVKYPFATAGGALNVSFDLQVPTAVGSTSPGNNAYVAADLEYVDPVRKIKISNGVNVFYINAKGDGAQAVGYDRYSGSYMVNAPLAASASWVHPLPGNSARTGVRWTGYRPFHFQVTQGGLRAALAALRAAYPSANISGNPRDYGLTQFHLNAELHCSGGHAELGWSMRNLKISTEKPL